MASPLLGLLVLLAPMLLVLLWVALTLYGRRLSLWPPCPRRVHRSEAGRKVLSNPLSIEQRKILGDTVGIHECFANWTEIGDHIVYWTVNPKPLASLAPRLRPHSTFPRRKLRLLLSLVRVFAKRLDAIHHYDFEEVEVELEAMYAACWSNMTRNYYQEPVLTDYFIQRVYLNFHSSNQQSKGWYQRLDEHVTDISDSWWKLFALFCERMLLPLFLTFIGIISAFAYGGDDNSEDEAFFYTSVALITTALTLQAYFVIHRFERSHRRYKNMLFFWTRRLVRLCFACDVVLKDYYMPIINYDTNEPHPQEEKSLPDENETIGTEAKDNYFGDVTLYIKHRDEQSLLLKLRDDFVDTQWKQLLERDTERDARFERMDAEAAGRALDNSSLLTQLEALQKHATATAEDAAAARQAVQDALKTLPALLHKAIPEALQKSGDEVDVTSVAQKSDHPSASSSPDSAKEPSDEKRENEVAEKAMADDDGKS